MHTYKIIRLWKSDLDHELEMIPIMGHRSENSDMDRGHGSCKMIWIACQKQYGLWIKNDLDHEHRSKNDADHRFKMMHRLWIQNDTDWIWKNDLDLGSKMIRIMGPRSKK